jgi:DNA-binding transcriptional LysR family regulator
VRLLVTPLSATMVLAPKLAAFARRFPDIVLEITTTQEGRTELVAAGFDAGIHLGESIQRDMVAVRVSLAITGWPSWVRRITSRRIPSPVHHTIYQTTDASTCAAAPAGRIAGSSRKPVRASSLM